MNPWKGYRSKAEPNAAPVWARVELDGLRVLVVESDGPGRYYMPVARFVELYLQDTRLKVPVSP